MQAESVIDVIATLTDAYPAARVGVSTVETYERGLSDLDVADVERAARDLIATSKFFPTVAELRRRALSRETPRAPGEPALTAAQTEALARETEQMLVFDHFRTREDYDDYHATLRSLSREYTRTHLGDWRRLNSRDRWQHVSASPEYEALVARLGYVPYGDRANAPADMIGDRADEVSGRLEAVDNQGDYHDYKESAGDEEK
ncbi:MAG: hypothetical protein ACJ741_11110 [Pyrinomonadaceae bacterium]